jgi:preprotein translocase subunit SecA
MIGSQLFSVLFRTPGERNFRRRFKSRTYLLEFDDVLNTEEEFIREQKTLIHEDRRLKVRLKKTAACLTADMIEAFDDGQWHDLGFSFEKLRDSLRVQLGYRLAAGMDSEELFHTELLQKRVVRDLDLVIEEREKITGPDKLNLFIRDLYIHAFDAGWKDYLERIRRVQEALYLWGEGEGNPLDEYRLDEYALMEQAHKEAARNFFLTPVDVFWKYDECFGIV